MPTPRYPRGKVKGYVSADVPVELRRKIDEIADRTDSTISRVVRELLTRAIQLESPERPAR